MSSWEIKDDGNHLSKTVGEHEITIKCKGHFYRVTVWKRPGKYWVEEQDIQGTSSDSHKRALNLGNQLVKQLRGKGE